MYQFSRSIYRELAPEVTGDRRDAGVQGRRRLLNACESAVERLASDRHYFARPERSLFKDVRTLFPLGSQMRVYGVIERHIRLAGEWVDAQADAGLACDGSQLCCSASTRRGTPCQRVPVPGSRYCPSHKHLDESFEATAA